MAIARWQMTQRKYANAIQDLREATANWTRQPLSSRLWWPFSPSLPRFCSACHCGLWRQWKSPETGGIRSIRGLDDENERRKTECYRRLSHFLSDLPVLFVIMCCFVQVMLWNVLRVNVGLIELYRQKLRCVLLVFDRWLVPVLIISCSCYFLHFYNQLLRHFHSARSQFCFSALSFTDKQGIPFVFFTARSFIE